MERQQTLIRLNRLAVGAVVTGFLLFVGYGVLKTYGVEFPALSTVAALSLLLPLALLNAVFLFLPPGSARAPGRGAFQLFIFLPVGNWLFFFIPGGDAFLQQVLSTEMVWGQWGFILLYSGTCAMAKYRALMRKERDDG